MSDGEGVASMESETQAQILDMHAPDLHKIGKDLLVLAHACEKASSYSSHSQLYPETVSLLIQTHT